MVALALGVVLILGGIAMDGCRGWLISRVTSRSLGTLAPGFAASDRGFQVYSGLVRTVGVVLVRRRMVSGADAQGKIKGVRTL